MSVAPIAGKGAKMQRDDWYTSARDPEAGHPEKSAATPPSARWRA
jgi:PmbA protein